MEEKLNAVIQTLCGLFENKAELKGFSDWDMFIGCILTLKNIAFELAQETEVKDSGEQDNISVD